MHKAPANSSAGSRTAHPPRSAAIAAFPWPEGNLPLQAQNRRPASSGAPSSQNPAPGLPQSQGDVHPCPHRSTTRTMRPAIPPAAPQHRQKHCGRCCRGRQIRAAARRRDQASKAPLPPARLRHRTARAGPFRASCQNMTQSIVAPRQHELFHVFWREIFLRALCREIGIAFHQSAFELAHVGRIGTLPPEIAARQQLVATPTLCESAKTAAVKSVSTWAMFENPAPNSSQH